MDNEIKVIAINNRFEKDCQLLTICLLEKLILILNNNEDIDSVWNEISMDFQRTTFSNKVRMYHQQIKHMKKQPSLEKDNQTAELIINMINTIRGIKSLYHIE
jgi:hypothetical protein